MLGLVVLAWGLLVAPVTHAFRHARDGQGHSHGALPTSEEHGGGSVEHLLAVATAAAAPLELVRVSTLVVLEEVARPLTPALVARNPVENPQGP